MFKLLHKAKRNSLNIVFIILTIVGTLNDLHVISLGIFEYVYNILFLEILVLVIDPVKIIYKRKDLLLTSFLLLDVFSLYTSIVLLTFSTQYMKIMTIFTYFLILSITVFFFPFIILPILGYVYIKKMSRKRGIYPEEYIADLFVKDDGRYFSRQGILNILKANKNNSMLMLTFFFEGTIKISFVSVGIAYIQPALYFLVSIFTVHNITKLFLIVLPYGKGFFEKVYLHLTRRKTRVTTLLDDDFYIDTLGYTHANLSFVSHVIGLMVPLSLMFNIYLLESFIFYSVDNIIYIVSTSVIDSTLSIWCLLWRALLLFDTLIYIFFITYYTSIFLRNKNKVKVKIRGDTSLVMAFYVSAYINIINMLFNVYKRNTDYIQNLPLFITYLYIFLIISTFILFGVTLSKRANVKLEKLSEMILLLALRLNILGLVIELFLIPLTNNLSSDFYIFEFTHFSLIALLLGGYISLKKDTWRDTYLLLLVFSIPIILFILEEDPVYKFIMSFLSFSIFLSVTWFYFLDKRYGKKIFLSCLSNNVYFKAIVRLLTERPMTLNDLIESVDASVDVIKNQLDVLLFTDFVSYKLTTRGKLFYLRKTVPIRRK